MREDRRLDNKDDSNIQWASVELMPSGEAFKLEDLEEGKTYSLSFLARNKTSQSNTDETA